MLESGGMTDIEKAINYWKQFKKEIKKLREIKPGTEWEEQEKATDLAISALEKQIPQMGVPFNSAKNHNFVECGACNRDMGRYYQYCPHCGQKAKWRDKYEH